MNIKFKGINSGGNNSSNAGFKEFQLRCNQCGVLGIHIQGAKGVKNIT